MDRESNGVVLGRPPMEDRNNIVQNNGFFVWQWIWLVKYAKRKGISAMALVRYIVTWFIDEVDPSRQDSVAEKGKESFELLISNAKSSKKPKKHSKVKKE